MAYIDTIPNQFNKIVAKTGFNTHDKINMRSMILHGIVPKFGGYRFIGGFSDREYDYQTSAQLRYARILCYRNLSTRKFVKKVYKLNREQMVEASEVLYYDKFDNLRQGYLYDGIYYDSWGVKTTNYHNCDY